MSALAGSRTRVYCLEGNNANRYGTLLWYVVVVLRRLLVMCHGLFCSSNLVVFNPKNGYCSY